MLVSMTGYGESTRARDGVRVRVELRAINHRYLRATLRCEGFLAFESRAEELVRSRIKRGSVGGQLKVSRTGGPDRYLVDQRMLQHYVQQLAEYQGPLPLERNLEGAALLLLPGVIQEQDDATSGRTNDLWDFVAEVVEEALSQLCAMRDQEGQAMQVSLEANLEALEACWSAVAERAPNIAAAYRQRLTERINQLLAEHGVSIVAGDLVREIGLYAERCDVSEELVRLKSHCGQFRQAMQAAESNGRKLDFLIQEMVRETNTLGAKANDAELAQHVVEMKSLIDRMREMVQNVE